MTAIFDKWRISDKIVGVVSDNEPTNAFDLLNKPGIRCAAHLLNLCARDALSDVFVEKILTKCRPLVGHFKRSGLAMSKIREIQRRLKMPIHKFTQEVPTRWNSTYYIIDRLYEQKESIVLYFNENTETDLDELSNSDWKHIETLLNILEPLEYATNKVSGEKYSSACILIPLITTVYIRLRKLVINDNNIKKFRDALVNSIERRFKFVETSRPHFIATLLDPRFKDKCFRSSTNREKAVDELENELIELNLADSQRSDNNTEQNSEQEITELTQKPTKRQKTDMWAMVQEQTQRDLSEADLDATKIKAELNLYFSLPTISPDKSIHKWWNENKSDFPHLYSLVSHYLCIPATSFPAERVFSKAGQIISERRARLKGKHADMLIFFNINYENLNL